MEEMTPQKYSNVICEAIARTTGGSYLDSENILWKLIDGNWMGKRSVYTFDFKSCWLEDTAIENIKSWWCGKDGIDYNEIFYRN